MDRGVVQGIAAVGNTQEPGALGKGGRAQAGHLQQFFAVAETPVFITVGNNVFGYGAADTGYVT